MRINIKLNLLVFLILPVYIFSQPRYKSGDTLFVTASNGLNMRDAVGLSANKIMAIPYGAAVIALQDAGKSEPFEVNELPSLQIDGFWVKVAYQGKEGFVFDGYLSRYPIPSRQSSYHYFSEDLKKRREDEVYRFAVHDEEKYPCHFSEFFEYNINRTAETCGEGGESGRIELPEGNIFEGFFLMKALFFNEENYKITIEGKDREIIRISPKAEWAGCEASLIMLSGGGVLIQYYCGC